MASASDHTGTSHRPGALLSLPPEDFGPPRPIEGVEPEDGDIDDALELCEDSQADLLRQRRRRAAVHQVDVGEVRKDAAVAKAAVRAAELAEEVAAVEKVNQIVEDTCTSLTVRWQCV
jgi:hypothetical protein